jgi:hypothetical protein
MQVMELFEDDTNYNIPLHFLPRGGYNIYVYMKSINIMPNGEVMSVCIFHFKNYETCSANKSFSMAYSAVNVIYS